MARMLPLLSAVALAAMTAAVAWQASTIGHLRAELSTAQAEATRRADALAAAERKNASLQEQNTAFRIEAKALREHSGTAAAEPAPAPAKSDPEKAPADFVQSVKKMWKSPEMRKMLRGQQEMAARMMYGDLARSLGLSKDEADAVMSLLAERQSDLTEGAMSGVEGEGEEKGKPAAGRTTREITDRYEQQLRQALGDRYPQLEAYEKTVGERMLLQQYTQQLNSAGLALTPEQNESMLQIMGEERARLPASPFNAASHDVEGQMKALGSDEEMHRLLAEQEEFDRRVRARAGSVLSPEQTTAFGEAQQRFMRMQEMGLQMSRTMFKPAK